MTGQSLGRIHQLMSDVQTMRSASTALKDSAKVSSLNVDFFDTFLETFPGGISVWDEANQLVAANSEFYKYTGLPHSNYFIELSFPDVVAALAVIGWYGKVTDIQACVSERMETIRRKEDQHFERTIPNGDVLEIRVAHFPNGGFVTSLLDVTERKRLEREIVRLAMHDPLTGLANRNAFNMRFSDALAMAKRTGHLVALVLIDLDNFKPVNDTLGHLAADALLSGFAKTLNGALRETDVAARLGGDEFAVILHALESRTQLDQALDRLQPFFNRDIELDGQIVPVSSSVGVALFPNHARDRSGLFLEADKALYAAKSAGRGCIRMASATD